jgi:hypothetical protein
MGRKGKGAQSDPLENDDCQKKNLELSNYISYHNSDFSFQSLINVVVANFVATSIYDNFIY